jgi:Asp-tRNA(Asn)/Glu-tRNA(Gln) amidotransferase A subunit family amidase
MMLVGRHFDDATVLRAGHAFQMENPRGSRPTDQSVESNVPLGTR